LEGREDGHELWLDTAVTRRRRRLSVGLGQGAIIVVGVGEQVVIVDLSLGDIEVVNRVIDVARKELYLWLLVVLEDDGGQVNVHRVIASSGRGGILGGELGVQIIVLEVLSHVGPNVDILVPRGGSQVVLRGELGHELGEIILGPTGGRGGGGKGECHAGYSAKRAAGLPSGHSAQGTDRRFSRLCRSAAIAPAAALRHGRRDAVFHLTRSPVHPAWHR
jgi:hypothetical protein